MHLYNVCMAFCNTWRNLVPIRLYRIKVMPYTRKHKSKNVKRVSRNEVEDDKREKGYDGKNEIYKYTHRNTRVCIMYVYYISYRTIRESW